MSFESVINRCMENYPDMNKEKLEVDLRKQAIRFEKIVKTSYNESFPKSLTQYGLDKNTDFEKHKLHYIHQKLEILIDLYDYKPE